MNRLGAYWNEGAHSRKCGVYSNSKLAYCFPSRIPRITVQERIIDSFLACEQALLFGRAKRVSRERASERRSREGQRKGELATIPYKFSFVLRPDEGKYHWLKNDVPENKVD